MDEMRKLGFITYIILAPHNSQKCEHGQIIIGPRKAAHGAEYCSNREKILRIAGIEAWAFEILLNFELFSLHSFDYLY